MSRQRIPPSTEAAGAARLLCALATLWPLWPATVAHAAPPAAPPEAAGAPETRAADAESAEAQKTLRKLVAAIRLRRDDKAMALIDFAAMSQRLCGEAWGRLSAEERHEVARGLTQILRAKSFERGRDIFQYLNTIRFEPARRQGELLVVHSAAVIFHELKKSEVLIDWVLARGPAGLRVVDTVMLGESTAAAIYEEQVQPLLREGGVPALMRALRAQVAEAEHELERAGAGAAGPQKAGASP